MAALEEYLISLNLSDYSQDSDSSDEVSSSEDDDCHKENPIILEFNAKLLDFMLSTKLVDADSVQKSIPHLISNYRRTAHGKTPEDLDYNDLDNCLGYLHRFSACHTALVRNALKKVFKIPLRPAIKRVLYVNDSLHVISLGGGPGNDVLGFCSALYGRHYGFNQITLTLVDQMDGWQEVFNQSVAIIRAGNYGNASALFKESNVETDFFRADLTNKLSWNYDFERRLETADICLLVKVLSVVPDTEKALFLKNIVFTMKPGSLLIYIDSPFPQKAFAEVEGWLDCVYECQKATFRYDYEVKRFGYKNLKACRAFVRVYVRRLIT